MLSPVDPEKSMWESMFSLRSTPLAFATIAQKLHTHTPAAVFTMRTPLHNGSGRLSTVLLSRINYMLLPPHDDNKYVGPSPERTVSLCLCTIVQPRDLCSLDRLPHLLSNAKLVLLYKASEHEPPWRNRTKVRGSERC